MAARLDSLERALAVLQSDTTRRIEGTGQRAATRRSNLSDRTMAVPVPEDGEIYVRFGDGGATGASRSADVQGQGGTPADIEERVQAALRRQLRQHAQADSAQALTDADLERLVQRTVRDAMRQRDAPAVQRTQTAQVQQIQRLQNQVDALQRQLREQGSDRPESVAPSSPDAGVPFYRQTLGRPLTYLVPIAGFRGGKGANQPQIGVRGDYRMSPSSRLHLVPELSFGVGGGQLSPTMLFSGAYSFLRDTTTDLVGVPLEPYVGLGAGISSLGGITFEPVITSMLGFDYRFRSGRRVFLEYSTFDRFSTHRVHVGLRVRL